MNIRVSSIGFRPVKDNKALKAWAKEVKDNGMRKRFAVRYSTYGGSDKLTDVMTALQATAFAQQMARELTEAFADEAAGNFTIRFGWNKANRPHISIDGGRGNIGAVGVVLVD